MILKHPVEVNEVGWSYTPDEHTSPLQELEDGTGI
jgi:hypothetical protein